ncbi:uncharacterized protein MYCFIDRAFT_177570 [Pseudocercospora fijiensis CIRAD86]|uniref:Uncharacterized protein n=1 Tax=Pseudocercospora fijiensis (strain CIRAD86) TaxID=383855 RepID=M3AU12_PSEFD|nr:uncharacterized protein MYCFIDRAFT_177570 [Pseudocercospora fijiensis CIRAD86]EME80638.1 hypothetical protein MYCFIDRAFT_177570 [Pseudocercospora fijiensis CIRAD86]
MRGLQAVIDSPVAAGNPMLAGKEVEIKMKFDDMVVDTHLRPSTFEGRDKIWQEAIEAVLLCAEGLTTAAQVTDAILPDFPNLYATRSAYYTHLALEVNIGLFLIEARNERCGEESRPKSFEDHLQEFAQLYGVPVTDHDREEIALGLKVTLNSIPAMLLYGPPSRALSTYMSRLGIHRSRPCRGEERVLGSGTESRDGKVREEEDTSRYLDDFIYSRNHYRANTNPVPTHGGNIARPERVTKFEATLGESLCPLTDHRLEGLAEAPRRKKVDQWGHHYLSTIAGFSSRLLVSLWREVHATWCIDLL